MYGILSSSIAVSNGYITLSLRVRPEGLEHAIDIAGLFVPNLMGDYLRQKNNPMAGKLSFSKHPIMVNLVHHTNGDAYGEHYLFAVRGPSSEEQTFQDLTKCLVGESAAESFRKTVKSHRVETSQFTNGFYFKKDRKGKPVKQR